MSEFELKATADALPAEPRTLSDAARGYLQKAFRPNTRRAYLTAQDQWAKRAARFGVAPYPATPTDVANWLAERAEAGQSVSTLRGTLAGVKAGHDARGMAFDSRAPVLTKVLRGVSNATSRLPRQAPPIRANDVLDLIAHCENTALGDRDACALAVAYIFATRRSELVAIDLEQQGAGDAVLRIGARSLELILGRSKTSANCEPETVTIPRAENAVAVAALEKWIRTANILPGEPLLRGVGSGGKIAPPTPEARGGNFKRMWGGHLHPQSFAAILKTRIQRHFERQGVSPLLAKKEAAKFSTHSLRVGFITTAAEGGADVRAIAGVSRHRSLSMVQRYARSAEQLKTSPHRLPGVGLGSRS